MAGDKELEEARLRKLLGVEEEDPRTEAERKADAMVEAPLSYVRPEFGEVENEFADRKKALDARLNRSKTVAKEAVSHESKQAIQLQTDGKGLAMGMSIAYVIIGLPVVAGILGLFLDRTLHTNLVGALTIGAVVLAMIYTVVVMNKANKS